MDLIEYTLKWVKGEILESIVMAILGLLIIISAVLLWKFGSTLNAKALILPLLIVGLIPATMGIAGAIGNNNSIPSYQLSWKSIRPWKA